MRTKIDAGMIATAGGTHMVIADGRPHNPLARIAGGGRCTWFLTPSNPATARKTWIAGALEPKGALIIDAGAAEALHKGAEPPARRRAPHRGRLRARRRGRHPRPVRGRARPRPRRLRRHRSGPHHRPAEPRDRAPSSATPDAPPWCIATTSPWPRQDASCGRGKPIRSGHRPTRSRPPATRAKSPVQNRPQTLA